MTDSAESASTEATVAQPVSASADGSSTPESQSGPANVVDEHPELLVGAAFAGGLLLAAILKRFAD